MSYPSVPTSSTGDPPEREVREFLLDLGSRKEFRSLAPAAAPAARSEASSAPHPYGFGLPGGPGDGAARDGAGVPTIPGLRLHGAQLFVGSFSNPDTPFTRLLLNWQTGAGKTIGAITIAQEYVRQYRSRITVPPKDRPTVFVVGFTKTIIQAEMLRHPEFGFVSPEEAVELRRLHALSEASGGPATPESRHYSSYVGVLKRRITDRARGGYYQFAGYKEFANRLFVVTRAGAARGFSVAGLYTRGGPARGARDDEDEDDEDDEAGDEEEPTFLERIDAAVEAGDVEVNAELLDALRGGLIVADEIHNTYNIQTKNNYGVALQYALDKIASEDPQAAPRAVFMSATVTGGSAMEIVDLLNFLVPVHTLPGGRRLRRADFFRPSEGADGRRVTTPLPGALDRIGRLSAGRVSFLLDTDEASYPRRIFEGEALANPLEKGDIAYLRFTPCPMSFFHEKTLAHMLGLRRPRSAAAERVAIPANAYTLYDMAYPNPEFSPTAAAERGASAKEAYGLYLSAETPSRLATAPPEWRAAAGVAVESLKGGPAVRAGVPSLISGPFLSLAPAGQGHASEQKAPPGVAAYSTKYHRLGLDVLDIISKGPGKILVYHHRVRMSGVLQIQEMLEMNGFIDETSAPSPSTICAVCGLAKRDHSAAAAKKTWAPAHGYAPARYLTVNSEIDRSVLDRSIARYNAPTNVEGFEYRVLVGSKIIREGFDLKAVRHELIASLPTDIPTLIQVFGRAVRKNSHVGLPEDQRDVRIRIYVSTAGAFTQGRGPAPEVMRYAEKMASYFLTQEVEKAVRRYAVDAFINYERMKAADPALLTKPNIDAVPYDPAITLAETQRRPETTATFEAYGYGDREVDTIKAAVTALFETRPVWTYADLWAAVRAGRVRGVAVDPASFSEESFALALDGLGLHSPFITRGAEMASRVNRGSEALISRVQDFYIRTPAGPGGLPVLDVESYVRDNAVLAPVRVKVADYVESTRTGQNFVARLEEFEADFADGETPIEDAFVLYDADFHYALMRAVVEGYALQGSGGGAAIAARVFEGVTTAGSALARVVDLYTRFKVLVLGGDAVKAPEAKRLLRAARAPRADDKTPIGYLAPDSVRLYSGAPQRGASDEGWYDIPRKALGVGSRYGENDVVVGYVERRGAHLRFKVRPPIHELSAADVRDARSLARGAVCETRPRAEQEELALRLKALEKGELAGLSSAEICAEVRANLLEREEAARNRTTGMLDGTRWFYLFNDRLPTVTLGR
jgi:hypothetical protein